MNRLRSLLAVAALGLAACAVLQDLITLQRGLANEFHTAAINVDVTNDHLTELFQDSTTAKLPETERADLARRVAGFVRDHYARYDNIADVSVGFAQVKRLGPLTSTRTEVPYAFSRIELGPPLTTPPAPVKR